MRLLYMVLLAGTGFGPSLCAELRLKSYPGNYVAAIVNETIITRGQVEEFTLRAIEPLFRIYQREELLERKVNEVLSEGLEQLVENQLILDDFKTGGARVPDALVDDEIKDRIRQHWQNRATLIKELNAAAKTYEAFRQQVREEMVLHFMNQKNVSAGLLISPQKIERYYATNLHQYQLGNQVKLRMIVLKCTGDAPIPEVRKLAQEISAKLDQGASFSEMATIYSEGSERKEGGNLPWMEESKTTRGFADIADGLKSGQHSGVLGFARETNDLYWMYQYDKAGQLTIGRKYTDKSGTDKNQLLEEKKFEAASNDSSLPAPPQEFRLMLVEDKRVARTESLTEVREKIEKELTSQERERLRKKWIARLRAKAFVRYY